MFPFRLARSGLFENHIKIAIPLRVWLNLSTFKKYDFFCFFIPCSFPFPVRCGIEHHFLNVRCVALILLSLSFCLAVVSIKWLPLSCLLTGNNCPGGCASCPCGTSSSSQSVSSWCSKYTGWKQASCECIMKAESGGNANAVNQNSGGSYDVGLWQINDMNWASCSGGAAPCDPSTNLNCGKSQNRFLHSFCIHYDAIFAAKKVFGWGGNTWKLWSTCSKCGVCSTN